MAYLLTILAGLALMTALYHAVAFWQGDASALRASKVIVWLGGFYTCLMVILQLGPGWEVSGFLVLIGALVTENVFAWYSVLSHMLQAKPGVPATPPPQTLVEMTHADTPAVIEATEKK